jgi:hypothetical protein
MADSRISSPSRPRRTWADSQDLLAAGWTEIIPHNLGVAWRAPKCWAVLTESEAKLNLERERVRSEARSEHAES